MADNYYSMQEVTNKLRKAEAEVQDLVKQGKLRQYMDAGKAVFKVEDVDALSEEIVGLDLSSAGIDLDAGSELDLELEETAGVPLESDLFDEVEEILPETEPIGETPELVDETLGLELEAEAAPEPVAADDTLDIMPDTEEETPAPAAEEPAQVDETLGLELEETHAPAEPEAPELVDETIGLEPDEDTPTADEDVELELDESKIKESEGGFGLSQMGDLTMADTNVGTVGINILSGTEDAFKLTDDTKSETLSADAEDIDELESLDADANMESFGSGSGLLDLSLQADDTSLGAVLDDILPAGAEEGGDLPVAGGLMDEEDLLSDSAPAAGDAEVGAAQAAVTAPMGPATATATAPLPGTQMIAAAVVDPKTNIYGVAMFLPLAAVIIAGIVMTAAIQDVTPSLMTTLVGNGPADISMIWLVAGGMAVAVLIILAFAAMLGGGGGGGSKVKKAKKAKKEKPKKKKRK